MPDMLLPSESNTRDDLVLRASLAVDRHPALVYLASLSPGSRRTMVQAPDTIAAILSVGRLDMLTLDWSALRYQHTAAVRAQLAARYRPATVNKMVSALRGVLHHAWKLGQMGAEDYHRACDLRTVKGNTLPAGRDLGIGEIAALMDVCAGDASPAGARDAAIIAIMYATGIRRASVIMLDNADYDGEAHTMRVTGAKGQTEYIAHVAQDGARQALADWLDVRGDAAGPLFWPINKSGRMTNRRLSAPAIYNMLGKRAEQAGINHFSPHDLRRTLAGDLLDAGADIVVVQKILGHANVTTTARYDRCPEDVKRKAAGLIHVPYRGRRQKRLESE